VTGKIDPFVRLHVSSLLARSAAASRHDAAGDSSERQYARLTRAARVS